MNHEEAGRYWNDNADAWTQLARGGFDLYRDALNTPAFFAMLPEVRGMHGIDVGCGEGHNTRLLAERGARMSAIDISENFIGHASDEERRHPKGIDYRTASAVSLPFGDASFHFATAFMSLMDMPEVERAVGEVCRVLKPGGFFQFSIEHPCFATPHRRNVRDASGLTTAVEVGDYFRPMNGDISEWTFKAAPDSLRQRLPRFRVPRFTRTLSAWLNLLIDAGFVIDRLEEPRPTDDQVRGCPQVQDAQVVAYFLHVRVKRP